MNFLKKLIFIKCRIWKYKLLSNCSLIIGKPMVHHPILVTGNGQVSFGYNVQIGVVSSPNFYSHYSYFEARSKESKISIGNNTSINNAFSAVAFSDIAIGNNVLIGVNCSIMDTDGHDSAIDKRNNDNPFCKPILIENNVFIGDNVTILKGVTIGENSVIGNGTIVTKDIPKNVIAVGNPARVIRDL